MADEVDIRPELKALCKKLGVTYSNVVRLEVAPGSVEVEVQAKDGHLDPMTNEVAIETQEFAVNAL